MPDQNLGILLTTSITIGFVHTALGPDHYIPFVALARIRSWSKQKTVLITALCGVGHVLGSIVLGALGIALGWALGTMQEFEGIRGDWAAWGLIGLGLAYMAWGIRRGIRNKPHTHLHVHADGDMHVHAHGHAGAHAHVHESTTRSATTPWMLFIIFVLGPCEPLIPLLLVPAASHSWSGVALVAASFSAVTIATMCTIVLGLSYGLDMVRLGRLERWSHALAGFSLFACGGAIKWLGL
jgi:sulfite exporter TauE/SafE